MKVRFKSHSITFTLALAATFATTFGRPAAASAQNDLQAVSPDGRIEVTVAVDRGRAQYAVQRDGRPVILPSRLGFEFRGASALSAGLRIASTSRNAVDQTWERPWGEVREVRDHHNEPQVSLVEAQPSGRTLDVVCLTLRLAPGGGQAIRIRPAG